MVRKHRSRKDYNICYKCGRIIREFPYRCHWCNRTFCSNHRLPEDHYCKPLERHKKHNQERWQEAIKKSFTPQNIIQDEFEDVEEAIEDIEETTKQIRRKPPYKERKRKPKSKIKPLIWVGAIILLIIFMTIMVSPSKYENKIKSEETHTLINSIREEKNLSQFQYQGKYYYEAVRISKLIYEEKEISSDYSYVSENIFHYEDGTIYPDMWNSLGHDLERAMSKSVLNSYNYGTVGCYGYVCTFVGEKIEEVVSEPEIEVEEVVLEGEMQLDYSDSMDSEDDSWFDKVNSYIVGPEIDEVWVDNFMSIVNSERASMGLHPIKESDYLNDIAKKRFDKMMEEPFISHYGADMYNVGEVVFYPEGFTEQEYIDDTKITAFLHWDLLVEPMFVSYGYHIEEGPTISVYEPCPITEIPGPNIDVEEFFRKSGCQTTIVETKWLVIDMI